MLKKLWHDPVWSKVIAAIILAGGALIVGYILNWWPILRAFLTRSLVIFLDSTPIPNWLISITALLALPYIIVIALVVRQAISPSAVAPSWKSYTTDIFSGLRWRWKYGDKEQIYNAHPYCPHCDYQVFPQDVSNYPINYRIRFHCDSCGRDLGVFDESFASLESKTQRFIQQKIRNGTWLSR